VWGEKDKEKASNKKKIPFSPSGEGA